MGESPTAIEQRRLLRRQVMRIRTIVVSFTAAVSSAHRDLDCGPAERHALIETWRAWSLEVLERYRAEVDQLDASSDGVTAEELTLLRSSLDDGVRRVREA